MNEIRTIAANASTGAYASDTGPSAAIEFVPQRFVKNAAGELEHYIDGELRATVPPEGWEAYADQWPDCRELVASRRQ